jgi:hypothetical protein
MNPQEKSKKNGDSEEEKNSQKQFVPLRSVPFLLHLNDFKHGTA